MALLPVDEALARILSEAKVVGAETVELDQALGRVTAKPILARRHQPPFPASAMDGYAVRHADIITLPAQLKQIGISSAGHAFRGALKPGTAVRIYTGAPVPSGADTVVIQENVKAAGIDITVVEPTAFGRNIRAAGLDFNKGMQLVPAGARLTARDLGLAASGNNPTVTVRKKIRVAILTTGDELVKPGEKARGDQIISSNSHAVAAFARSCGAEVIDLGIIKDDLRLITSAIKRAFKADVLVTTGGASVGDHDFVQEALKRAGVKIDFWKIAMRPGKPFMFGRKGKLHVLGLPGNPVAALVCCHLFLRPLIEKMFGLETNAETIMAQLGADVPANDLRQDYLRAQLTYEADGRRIATPHSKQDSSMQRVLRQAGCLIIRPPHARAAKVGDLVPILLFLDGV